MILDLTVLENVIHKLEKIIEYSKSEIAIKDAEIFEQFRNCVIGNIWKSPGRGVVRKTAI